MREAIRSNWSTTGQELGKELRQFWQSRPGSPARMHSYEDGGSKTSLTSPSALSHLSSRLELPRGHSPGPGSDFATGYSLGLIGGVRSWVQNTSLYNIYLYNIYMELITNAHHQMTRSRQTNRDNNGSDSSEEDSEEHSPPRGRTGQQLEKEEKEAKLQEAQVTKQIDAMMEENSKASGA